MPEETKLTIVNTGLGFPKSQMPAAIGNYAIMQGDRATIGEIIRENIGPPGIITEFTLDRVKVPSQGSRIWSIPSLEGPQDVKEIEGVVVAWKEPRAYWATSFDESGGGTPPDCASADGYHGVGNPGGDCNSCPFSQFGSADGKKAGDKGRGQACKQVRLLFLLQPNTMLPIVVVCPPTSLSGARKYFLRLAANSVPYYGVVTKLTLVEDKNADGIKYSRIEFAAGGRLTPDEADRIRDYGANFRPAIDAARVESSDIRE